MSAQGVRAIKEKGNNIHTIGRLQQGRSRVAGRRLPRPQQQAVSDSLGHHRLRGRHCKSWMGRKSQEHRISPEWVSGSCYTTGPEGQAIALNGEDFTKPHWKAQKNSRGITTRAPRALVVQRNQISYVRESQATLGELTFSTETRPVRVQARRLTGRQFWQGDADPMWCVRARA
jgi:hypothetical protein